MARYTAKNAATYMNKLLNNNLESNRALLNAWNDNFDRWFACDGYRAYRLEGMPDGIRVRIDVKPAPHEFDRIHNHVENMFDSKYIDDVTEIPVDIADIVAASRTGDHTIDLGENFPVVNAKHLRDAMEMLPDGKVYCTNNARRMVSPVYVKSENGVALILPILRENKLHWTFKKEVV